MKKIKVLVADSDPAYAAALGEMLANKFDVFHITVVPPPSKWTEEEKKKAENCDLILCNQIRKCEEENEKEKTGSYLMLSESESPGNTIDRYSGASAIAAELMTRYAEKAGIRPIRGNAQEVPLFVFTSGAGGVGKTAVAIATARELSVFHKKKILYLSFEEPESTIVYCKGEGGSRGVNNYLYYLFSNIERQDRVSPDAFLSTDRWGVDYFHPAEGRNELRDLTEEQFETLRSALCSARGYQAICIDFPFEDSELGHTVLQRAAGIVLLCDGSPVSKNKNETLQRTLSAIKQRPGGLDVLKVRNKWNLFTEAYEEGDEACSIDYDPSSFRIEGDFVAIETDRSFGVGVKRLADQIGRAL